MPPSVRLTGSLHAGRLASGGAGATTSMRSHGRLCMWACVTLHCLVCALMLLFMGVWRQTQPRPSYRLGRVRTARGPPAIPGSPRGVVSPPMRHHSECGARRDGRCRRDLAVADALAAALSSSGVADAGAMDRVRNYIVATGVAVEIATLDEQAAIALCSLNAEVSTASHCHRHRRPRIVARSPRPRATRLGMQAPCSDAVPRPGYGRPPRGRGDSGRSLSFPAHAGLATAEFHCSSAGRPSPCRRHTSAQPGARQASIVHRANALRGGAIAGNGSPPHGKTALRGGSSSSS